MSYTDRLHTQTKPKPRYFRQYRDPCQGASGKNGTYGHTIVIETSAFKASGGMPSGPAALPALIAFTALLISALVCGLVFTFSRLSAGNIDGRCSGEGLLRVSLKQGSSNLFLEGW